MQLVYIRLQQLAVSYYFKPKVTNSVYNNYIVVVVIILGDLASGNNYKQIITVRTGGLSKLINYQLSIKLIENKAFVSNLKSIKALNSIS